MEYRKQYMNESASEFVYKNEFVAILSNAMRGITNKNT